MKERKVPMRTCIVTKEKLPKRELIRIVRMPDGVVVIDETGRTNGRGAYLKRDVSIYEQARKSKVLERHLDVTIPDEIYEQLKLSVN